MYVITVIICILTLQSTLTQIDLQLASVIVCHPFQ